jgi:hypothetical protein
MAATIVKKNGLLLAAGLVALATLITLTIRPGNAEEAAEETVVLDDLMWAARSNGEDVPWEPANEYCEALEAGGYGDWRLPTLAELESVYDPSAADNGYIASPLVLDGCCLWSSTSLADFSADEAGLRGGQRDDPQSYFWGLLYDGGIRYYSILYFPDGQAQCVRDVG